MSNITNISINVLKIHPRNQEFFDDISGEDYERFKTSIREDGVVTPLIVAPDMTIISGHQRAKACIDLGIDRVPVIIREDINDEDEKLKLLLATNFGRTKNDPAKQRKIMTQYVELCGLKNGVKKLGGNRLALKEIAKVFGVSETVLKENLFIERKLTPELKELLDDGKITKSTARHVLARLSPEEQKEVLEDLGVDGLSEKTQAQLKDYVKKLQAKEEENEKLKKALEKEKNKPKEKEIVVEPDTKAQEELKTLRQDKVKLLEELEILRKEMFNTPSTQQEDAKVKELEEKIAKLQSDLDFKDELIKDKDKLIENRDNLLKEKDNLLNQKENLIENEKELKESYKKGYDEYYNLINTTCDYQSTEESVGRSVGAGYETVKFLIDIEELLKYKLAPLKYERFLRDIKSNETVLNNVNELLDVVQSWTDEMRSLVNGVSHTSNNGIINNFVDGVIVE